MSSQSASAEQASSAANYGASTAVKLGFVSFAVLVLLGLVGLKVHEYGQFREFSTLSVMDPVDLRGGAPDFSLPSGPGKEMKSLQDYKGAYTLVHLWATWCSPCREELASLEYFTRRYQGRVQVLALSVDDGWAEVQAFFAGHAPSFQLLWDKDRQVANRYGTRQYPETYLVDPQGQLVTKFIGARPWNSPEARRYFDTLLGS